MGVTQLLWETRSGAVTRTCSAADMVGGASYSVSSLTTAPCGRSPLAHVTDRDAEALRGWVTGPKTSARKWQNQVGPQGPAPASSWGLPPPGRPGPPHPKPLLSGEEVGRARGWPLTPGCPQHTSGCTGRLERATCSGISPGPCTPSPWSPSPPASPRASRPSQEVSPVTAPFACAPRTARPAGRDLFRWVGAGRSTPFHSQAQRSHVARPKSHSGKVRSRLLGCRRLWSLSESFSGW